MCSVGWSKRGGQLKEWCRNAFVTTKTSNNTETYPAPLVCLPSNHPWCFKDVTKALARAIISLLTTQRGNDGTSRNVADDLDGCFGLVYHLG